MTETANMAEQFNTRQSAALPGLLGLNWSEVTHGRAVGRFEIKPHHMAPNGFLHAASLVALLDTACGYGCVASLPEGATGFTTVELKSNHLGTARDGVVSCEARLVHAGRSTQLWGAEARHEESGRLLALFRCTQMILYPRG